MKKLSKMLVLLLSVIALCFTLVACDPSDPAPSVTPSVSAQPTAAPTVQPTVAPTVQPTVAPTAQPTVAPTAQPTVAPTVQPTVAPTAQPTVVPSVVPSVAPSVVPSVLPSVVPSVVPSVTPSVLPSVTPSVNHESTQVTEEEWKTALNEMGDYSGTETISNAVYMQVITFSRKGDVLKVGNEMIGFSYVSKEGDLYYLYEDESKTEISQEEYEMQVHPYGYMAEAFAAFTYNAEKQAYVMETEGVTMSIYMQNKKLVKVEIVDGDMSLVDEITYGEVEDIVLPEVVDPYKVTEDQFAKAVDFQAMVFGDERTNFSFQKKTYDTYGKLYETRTYTYYENFYYYEILYANSADSYNNTWTMWYAVPEEDITSAQTDIRYYQLYKYGDETTWRGMTYSAAKGNWSDGTSSYLWSKKSPLYNRVVAVPGQIFKDSEEPPFSTEVHFEYFTYNAQEGYYYADTIDVNGTIYNDVCLFFENGALQGFTYANKYNESYEITILYGEDVTPVELPDDIIVEND